MTNLFFIGIGLCLIFYSGFNAGAVYENKKITKKFFPKDKV